MKSSSAEPMPIQQRTMQIGNTNCILVAISMSFLLSNDGYSPRVSREIKRCFVKTSRPLSLFMLPHLQWILDFDVSDFTRDEEMRDNEKQYDENVHSLQLYTRRETICCVLSTRSTRLISSYDYYQHGHKTRRTAFFACSNRFIASPLSSQYDFP